MGCANEDILLLQIFVWKGQKWTKGTLKCFRKDGVCVGKAQPWPVQDLCLRVVLEAGTTRQNHSQTPEADYLIYCMKRLERCCFISRSYLLPVLKSEAAAGSSRTKPCKRREPGDGASRSGVMPWFRTLRAVRQGAGREP